MTLRLCAAWALALTVAACRGTAPESPATEAADPISTATPAKTAETFPKERPGGVTGAPPGLVQEIDRVSVEWRNDLDLPGVEIARLDVERPPRPEEPWRVAFSARGQGRPGKRIAVEFRDGEGRVIGLAPTPIAFPTPGESWVRCRVAGPTEPTALRTIDLIVIDAPPALGDPEVEYDPRDFALALASSDLERVGGGWGLRLGLEHQEPSTQYARLAVQWLDPAGTAQRRQDVVAWLPPGRSTLELRAPALSAPLARVRVFAKELGGRADAPEVDPEAPPLRHEVWPNPVEARVHPWSWGPIAIQIADEVGAALYEVEPELDAWEWACSLETESRRGLDAPQGRTLQVQYLGPAGELLGEALGHALGPDPELGPNGFLRLRGRVRGPTQPADVRTIRIGLAPEPGLPPLPSPPPLEVDETSFEAAGCALVDPSVVIEGAECVLRLRLRAPAATRSFRLCAEVLDRAGSSMSASRKLQAPLAAGEERAVELRLAARRSGTSAGQDGPWKLRLRAVPEA